MPTRCIVHPLVLLSATDHYMRVFKDSINSNKRVIGVLLGAKEIAGERDTWKTTTASSGEAAYSQAGVVNITNSFAVPFEEDEKDPKIWFVDHNYLENMFGMFKKVNARERIVGWYTTGPKIRASDLEINEVFKKFTKNPVLVIIDVQPKDELGLPTDAYIATEEVKDVSFLALHAASSSHMVMQIDLLTFLVFRTLKSMLLTCIAILTSHFCFRTAHRRGGHSCICPARSVRRRLRRSASSTCCVTLRIPQ